MVVGVALATVSIVGTRVQAGEGKDIVETAVQAGSFNTLAAALQAAGLVEALQGTGPFTVFAPTDEAFGKLPKETIESLLKPENKKQLVGILTYHVVNGEVPAKKVLGLTGATTLNGQRIDIRVDGNDVSVDGAKVLKTDIACSNGIIHVIDNVILPSSDNIPTTASKAGKFSTLLAAAKAAGLVDALSAEGPLTVFAPTDEAFSKLPAGTVESLLKPENRDKLAAILKYHVVSGRIYSDDAVAAKSAKTLQGQAIKIAVENGKAMINNANLLKTDIDASNGVIHVIDAVLLPAAKQEVSRSEARQMIEHSISRGVKLFNSGHHAACADIYMSTARKMMSYGDQMPPAVMTSLSDAVAEAESVSCPTQRSWTLRHGLDRAYYAMRR
jgi:uncharacterized surface protein with fasciclin (FAS1) repeats